MGESRRSGNHQQSSIPTKGRKGARFPTTSRRVESRIYATPAFLRVSILRRRVSTLFHWKDLEGRDRRGKNKSDEEEEEEEEVGSRRVMEQAWCWLSSRTRH